MNRGEYLERTISGNPQYITAEKPILVAQFTTGETCNSQAPSGQGDPSMLLLSSVEQTRENVTLYSSRFENISFNYVNIIARTDEFPGITFDGSPVSSLGEPIVPVGALPEFSYVSLQVGDGQHRIESTGCGVIASAYGYGEVESYAYSAGASFRNLSLSPIPDGGCLNDTIFFDTGIPAQYMEASWDFGDGTTANGSQVSHIYKSLGNYEVTLFTHNLCLDTYDTLEKTILVSLRQAVSAGNDTAVCKGSDVKLRATDVPGSTFLWNGPNEFTSEEQNPLLGNLEVHQSGSYQVVATFSGCATFPAFTEIQVHDPVPELGPDSSFCPLEGETYELIPGNFTSYLWSNGSKRNTLEVTSGGLYHIHVWDELGCQGNDTVLLKERCPTHIYFPNAFSPNGDGKNDYFKLIAGDVEAYSLMIYDRWGRLVFQAADPESEWDGTFQGAHLPEGVYVWRVAYDGYSPERKTYHFERSGTVTLIR